MNQNMKNRLENYKFSQALNFIENEPDEVLSVINALSTMYGNVGCGLEGASQIIVNAALKGIGVFD